MSSFAVEDLDHITIMDLLIEVIFACAFVVSLAVDLERFSSFLFVHFQVHLH